MSESERPNSAKPWRPPMPERPQERHDESTRQLELRFSRDLVREAIANGLEVVPHFDPHGYGAWLVDAAVDAIDVAVGSEHSDLSGDRDTRIAAVGPELMRALKNAVPFVAKLAESPPEAMVAQSPSILSHLSRMQAVIEKVDGPAWRVCE